MSKSPAYWSSIDAMQLKQIISQLTQVVKDAEMNDNERVALMLGANHNMSRLAAAVLSRQM